MVKEIAPPVIPTSVHPDYFTTLSDWEKYRYTMNGGDTYIEEYLIKFSDREGTRDFDDRKVFTPVPGFATAALIDVKNAIFQRMDDIKRKGGSETYQEIIIGLRAGVDLNHSTMNHFIGKTVLPELVFLGKVGIYVDMPRLQDEHTKTEASMVHPYLYIYKTEQIRNWTWMPHREGIEFDKILLEETHLAANALGLPDKEETRYRLIERVNGQVTIKFYDSENKQINYDGEYSNEVITLNLDRIPFVLLELERPLLRDIANHQIALMNMESSDVAWSLRANLPFYVEQTSGRFGSTHLKNNETSDEHDAGDIDVGAVHGRRYNQGLDQPDFIHPSAEPLMASMEKQKNLKEDIRTLINLALSAIRPKYSSAESKEMDEKGLESGLSFLGLVLEQGERQIATHMAAYENDKDVATIHYPARYSLKTDSMKLSEAESLAKQMTTVPSKTFQKAVAKEIATTLLDNKISNEDLAKILKEIDTAKWISSNAEEIHIDLERGLVSLDTGSSARGYEDGEVAKAEEDHAKRVARIKDAQESNDARGVEDESGNPGEGANAEKLETQDPDLQDTGSKAVRGQAK